MKTLTKSLIALYFFTVTYGCSKDTPDPIISRPTDADTLTVLSTKWKIIQDSVVSANYTFPWGGIPIPGVYHGVQADYYMFDSLYTVTVYENGHFATGKYKLLSNSQFLIDVTSPAYIGTIKTLNNLNATFEWELFSSNGGRYFRRLSLKK